jgi:ligand-binding sensor domain-containing protein
LTINETPDGILWFGTFDGISRFDGKEWLSYTEKDGLFGEVHDIDVDQQGILWVGTSEGLYRFNGKAWKGFTTSDGLGGNNIGEMAIGPDGAIWVATGGGLSRYIPPTP